MKAKKLKHPLVLAILAIVFTSCFSSREMYSQGYDNYYEEEYYEEEEYLEEENSEEYQAEYSEEE